MGGVTMPQAKHLGSLIHSIQSSVAKKHTQTYFMELCSQWDQIVPKSFQKQTQPLKIYGSQGEQILQIKVLDVGMKFLLSHHILELKQVLDNCFPELKIQKIKMICS